MNHRDKQSAVRERVRQRALADEIMDQWQKPEVTQHVEPLRREHIVRAALGVLAVTLLGVVLFAVLR